MLLVGAGPVGIELAGEIRHVWPDKSIVLLDAADEVLGGPFKSELKAELRTSAGRVPRRGATWQPVAPAAADRTRGAGTFTVTTETGVEVTADIWFRCYGVVPNSDYLGEELAPARRSDGFIEVGPTLQVAGQTTVFALGDLSTADAKMAGYAGRQAATVAATSSPRLRKLRAPRLPIHGHAIAVPIGPTGGAGQFPGQDEIVGREVIAEVKGRDMMVDRFTELFGLAVAAGE